ncbi:acyltransferase family protein [Pseudomonas coleopterorum]|uniref:acyltransferase family protein n=1 Tax=Pseudomonas coleopterorum TaxID=1605838 RepID=UPI00177EF27C|nr:acyltransferase [Pseudomonas coleopterorum]MBD8481810.1 acyltransferase [Pseudomonas coleopterorum]
MTSKTEKAIFANQLRAIAIICVVLVHWLGVYWLARETVAQYIYAPLETESIPNILDAISFRTLNYGPLGVSIFFLVSGFVIPFSITKLTRAEFILGRIFRIYPTYVAATAVSICCAWLSSIYWNSEFSLDLETTLYNLALIHSNTYKSTIDLVNWSLAIEIKFYIVSAVLYRSIREGSIDHLALLAIAVIAFCQWIPPNLSPIRIGEQNLSLESIKTELMVIIFMFIGTCFYHHYTGSVSMGRLIIYVGTLFGSVLICWPHTEWAGGIPYVPMNYAYGLLVFMAFYALRNKIGPFKPLDFIASISYPLYIIHSICGYALIRVLTDLGAKGWQAIIVALPIVIAAAYLLHKTIETYTMHTGKRIANKFSGKLLKVKSLSSNEKSSTAKATD